MCPHCGYNPDWQARGLEAPPDDYCGPIFEGPEMTQACGGEAATRRLYGCPVCCGVWMDY